MRISCNLTDIQYGAMICLSVSVCLCLSVYLSTNHQTHTAMLGKDEDLMQFD